MLLRRTRLALLAAPQLRNAESVLPVAEAIGQRARLGRGRIARRGRGLGRRARRRGHATRPGRGLSARGRGEPRALAYILPPMAESLKNKHLADLHELAAERGSSASGC